MAMICVNKNKNLIKYFYFKWNKEMRSIINLKLKWCIVDNTRTTLLLFVECLILTMNFLLHLNVFSICFHKEIFSKQ